MYLNDWRDIEGLKHDFDLSEKTLMGAEILFASYSYENYSGSAFVLGRRGNDFFEVNGSHCSCNGLEGQWSEEPTTLEAIADRLKHGLGRDSYCGNEFGDQLTQLVDEIMSGVSSCERGPSNG